MHWCGIVLWPPQTPLRPTQPPHSWPVPTNLAKPPSGSCQAHTNHRHNRPVQFSTFREGGGSSSALQQALTTKPAQVLTRGTVSTIPHTFLCCMYVAIASEPSGGTATTQRSIVNAREPHKWGRGDLTQTSPMVIEGAWKQPIKQVCHITCPPHIPTLTC